MSVVALLFSLVSLCISLYSLSRDNAKLVTKSMCLTEGGTFVDERQPDVLRLEAVNAGRRPIVLTAIIFKYDNGDAKAHPIDFPNGRTLKEQEHFFEDFDTVDSMLFIVADDALAVDAWFRDTQGRNHTIHDVKKNLKQLFVHLHGIDS